VSPWASPKLGCFGWALLVAMCGWPLHALGMSDNASLIGGVIISSVVLIAVGAMHRHSRIEEMREAQRR
jgi:hypothetical protein